MRPHPAPLQHLAVLFKLPAARGGLIWASITKSWERAEGEMRTGQGKAEPPKSRLSFALSV